MAPIGLRSIIVADVRITIQVSFFCFCRRQLLISVRVNSQIAVSLLYPFSHLANVLIGVSLRDRKEDAKSEKKQVSSGRDISKSVV